MWQEEEVGEEERVGRCILASYHWPLTVSLLPNESELQMWLLAHPPIITSTKHHDSIMSSA